MRGRILSFFTLLLLLITTAFSQQGNIPTQTIKGTVINFKNHQPVPGASVLVEGTRFGAYSDDNGNFKIRDVPVGRHKLRISSIGYETQAINIILNSGKQENLHIELNESYVETKEVNVTAKGDRFKPINESAIVSSTLFSKDDVERFAGSRMDPARMAQNFAGVVGSNDLRNDIIVRGGSPTELLWRLDGLDIPNPNHFATQGATGGPVSAINSTTLDNSDFLTGAFPAEYGDRMSGVFDLRTRKGNDEKYEFMGQFGFNGFEGGAEGPLPGINGSFILNYRYSFLGLLQKLGVDFGFSGIPKYQDGTLKVDYQAGGSDKLSLTGIMGISNIDLLVSNEENVYTGDFDVYSGTDFYALGLNWQHLFSDKLYGKMLIGTNYAKFRNKLDSITTDENRNILSINRNVNNLSTEGYHNIKYELYFSPDKSNYITGGAEARQRYYDLFGEKINPAIINPWHLDEKGTAMQYLAYINWNRRMSKNFTADLGLHSQYLEISGKYTLEPRLGLSYEFLPGNSFNAGFGIHRQSLPLLIYFSEESNKKLDFMQSVHYVAGYSRRLSEDAMLKVEAYYKDISKAPVERDEKDSWSFLNSGANFGLVGGFGDRYISKGEGKAYGVDVSLIKNFTDHYYVTATASYIRQQYKGSDGIWRFGAFDNIYVLNLLSGYEWEISPVFVLEFSGRYILAGGTPYTPIDLEASMAKGKIQYIDGQAYSKRNPDYSRLDVRVDFRNNLPGFSVISYISFENFLNNKNVLLYSYDAYNKQITTAYQLGFFFVGGVRVEF